MPDKVVSQRTIANVKRVFDGLTDNGTDFRDALYENGFPDWFIRQVYHKYRLNWMEVQWGLRNGTFFYVQTGPYAYYRQTILPERLLDVDQTKLGEVLIQKLAAFAFVKLNELPHEVKYLAIRQNLPRSLELDGFDVNREKIELVPLEGPVSAREEENSLVALVKSTGLPNTATIVKHIEDASRLFEDGKDHPSLGESRNILQALIDDISSETDAHGAHPTKLPGGTKQRIEYLKNVNFFIPDEETAFYSAWGSLSAGSHPGVPEREHARIGLVLALEFGQLLSIKFKNWKAGGYKCFKVT